MAEEVDYESEDEKTTTTTTKKTGGGSAMHSANFKDFVLRPELLNAITECGFETPSQVQQECIPVAMHGSDIICQARSGMGKTAVFVLATLHLMDLEKENQCQVLVLCHARELAYQISKEYKRFSKYMRPDICEVFIGGIPLKQNIETLAARVPPVIVGTPGRVLDLATQKKLDLSKVSMFVIDECDRVLGGETRNGVETFDMRSEVQKVFAMLPLEKQVMMYSATLPPSIRSTLKKFCRDANPKEVFVDDTQTLKLTGLLQYMREVEEKEKSAILSDIIDNYEFNQVVIFVSNFKRCQVLSNLMNEAGFPSNFIHGKMKQEERIKRFDAFKSGEFRILLATDLLGRGIDIENVNLVINYDFPSSDDQYLHRVARAGRFDTKGLAISFISTPEDKEILAKVQSRFDVSIPVLPAEVIDYNLYKN